MLPFSQSRRPMGRQRNNNILWMYIGCAALSLCVVLFLFFQLNKQGNTTTTTTTAAATTTQSSPSPSIALPLMNDSDDSDDSFDIASALHIYNATQRRQLANHYLFVRGYAKSGTSWSKMLIDLHEDIYLFPYELQLGLVDDGVARATASPWQGSNEPYKSIIENWAEQLVFQIMETARIQQPNVRFIGEKSPKAVAPLIHGARYVYVLRDGRDVIISLLAHRVRIGGFTNFCPGDRMFGTPEALVAELSRDWSFFEQNPHHLLSNEPCIRHLAANWAHRVAADLRLLETYDANMYMIVPYEQVTQDAEGTRRRIYQWLALDPRRSEPLGLYTMPLAGLAADSEFRPKNPFFRKGEPGEWRKFFHDDAKRWFKEEPGTQRLLEQLKYVKDGEW